MSFLFPPKHAVIPRILPFVPGTTVGPAARPTFDVLVEVSFSGDYVRCKSELIPNELAKVLRASRNWKNAIVIYLVPK